MAPSFDFISAPVSLFGVQFKISLKVVSCF